MAPPEVQVEEEASNLLQADTFRHLRLANPPLEHWEHFDTMQVLQRPYYVSIRPPGYSVFLAIGGAIFGTPWAGVCLAMGFMCGAFCWMLQGWVPARWALFGAILQGLRVGVLTFWMNSYWGGAACAAGAALVIGAYPRLLRRPRLSVVLVACVGFALLVTTRTYEGGLLLLGIATAFVIHAVSRKNRFDVRKWSRAVLVPAAGFVVLFGTWIGYYNWRTTGSPFNSTYTMGRKTQNIAPPFVFGKPSPIHEYTNPQMRVRYVDWELRSYRARTRWPGWKYEREWRFRAFWGFYIRPVLTVPLLFAFLYWRNRTVQFCALVAAIGIFGSQLEVWGPPYYFAPFFPVVVLAAAQGFRIASTVRIEGRRIFRLVPHLGMVVAVIVLAWLSLNIVRGVEVVDEGEFQWSGYQNRMPHRAEVQRTLEAVPGKHLVFVRYEKTHNELCEWVFNDADLNESKIIWAREYQEQQNAALAADFPDRRVWVINADSAISLPRPYLRSASQTENDHASGSGQ